MAAVGAMQQHSRSRSGLPVSASWKLKPLGPAQANQVLATGRLGRKSRLELPQGFGIIIYGATHRMLGFGTTQKIPICYVVFRIRTGSFFVSAEALGSLESTK